MMKMIKLGAILALCVGGQAMGQTSKISYQLELGGDNHASGAAPSWENPTGCVPPAFTPGSTSDGQTYTSAGVIVTWAARVFVTGTHSNTFPPSGAANLVANLELRQGSATGALVTGFGHGSPSVTGWFSTINDGDGQGSRSLPSGPPDFGCGFPADPLEDAAFAVSFDIESQNPPRARVIDGPGDAGPFLDYFMYPSSAVHPAGSTALEGELLGIGAGYSRYAGFGCPSDCGFGSGLNTAGVGITSAVCGVAMGNGPVFEGQLNTSGLPDGTYVLVLVPGTGNNIVNGDFLCDAADPGAFALAPDLATEGDTITFVLDTGEVEIHRTITQWRSMRTHSAPAGELEIVLNATVTGNGTGGPTSESRGIVGSGTAPPGVMKIQVDFNDTITLVNAANITVTYRVTTPGSPATMGGPIVTVPSSVVLADSNTLNILFAANQIPNLTCININIGAGTLGEIIDGDADCNVRSLSGDCQGTGNGIVQLNDQLVVKAAQSSGATVPPNQRYDMNLNGLIQLGDWLAIKAQIKSPANTALCP